MTRILIRFNKTRGQPGRGTVDHVWRVFNEDEEYLVKHVSINVPSFDAKTTDNQGNDDWNICCYGELCFNKENSTAIIKPEINS